MRLRLLLLFLALFFPLSSYGAYNIYLKNGSVIKDVGSYERIDGELIINFNSGTVGIQGKDILNIEETASKEKDLRFKEIHRETSKGMAPTKAPLADNNTRANELRTNLGKINSEIKIAEDKEAEIFTAITEKKGTRLRHTRSQLQHIGKEIEPLQQELADIQDKKKGLLQQKNRIEDDLRYIE